MPILCYINSVCHALRDFDFVGLKAYADDFKVYAKVTDLADRARLQKVIDEFVKWSRDLDLNLSSSKCQVIRFGGNNLLLDYNIQGRPIESMSSVRDIGVTVDSRLTFGDHVTDVVRNASTKTNFMLRCFTVRKPEPCIKMYRSIVLPAVLYASAVWYPPHRANIEKLNKLQNYFRR